MSADHADRSRSLPMEPGRENWLRLVRNRKQRERYGPSISAVAITSSADSNAARRSCASGVETRSVPTRPGTSITTTGSLTEPPVASLVQPGGTESGE